MNKVSAILSAVSASVQRAIGVTHEDRFARLTEFGHAMATLRDDAVKAREESGIELIWAACEEAYHGVDDKNRSQWLGMTWQKPTTMQGPLRKMPDSDGGTKSTAFVRVTARYVHAGATKLGEVTLPVDGPAFKLGPTPLPDLDRMLDDDSPAMDGAGQPLMRAPMPNEDVPAGPDGQPMAQVPAKVKDVAAERQKKASDQAERASKRINDWLTEGKHVAEMRKVEFDMARLGSGVLKGPVPFTRTGRKVRREGGSVVALEVVKTTKPRTRWVDIWNLFPARDCGEDIHEGNDIWERDRISARSLEALKGQPGYIAECIDKVLAEGPEKCNIAKDGSRPTAMSANGTVPNDKRFTLWHGYAAIKRSDLAMFSPDQADDFGDDVETVFGICTMVNDTVVRAVVNPIDTGSFPYHVGRWGRRAGHWSGIGVAEQLYLPQRMVNGATRAMMDNGGQSAGALIVMMQDAITAADGSNNINPTPGKLYKWNPGAGTGMVDDVSKAFATFTIPNVTPQLMTITEYGFKLAEESTNIPLVTQGQSGDTSPSTYGAAQLQDNNANQFLRDLGHAVADQITNPMVDQMYEWLLLDPDVPDDEKGDFVVDTNAAAQMVEKAIQDITIMQMGSMAANPAFGIDPVKWSAQMMRTKRLDPESFQYSEEERERMAKNQPPPVQLQVAQVRAQSAEKIAQGHDQATVAKMRADTDRDTVYVQAEMARAQSTEAAKIAELQLKRELAMLDYANTRQMTLEQVKADLAQTAMKLNTQIMLSKADTPGETITPPSEPAGQADPGDSYEA